MKIVLSYSNRSCKTGRALSESFKTLGHKVVTIRKNKIVKKADVVIRWGNSMTSLPIGKVNLNSADAVNNASNKKMMINLLKDAEITVPKFFNVSDGIPDD